MSETNNKMILICKPEQSGKTFVMIKQIVDEFQKSDELLTVPINIIICDNNLLLTRQTQQRVNSDISEQGCIEFSSKSEYRTTNDVFAAIINDELNVKNIICCSNAFRIKDIKDLIENKVGKSKFLKGQYHFNIWWDEADKFVKQIDNVLTDLVQTNNNVYLKLLTATPESLFQKYKRMTVFPIENTFDTSKYHGWGDNVIEKIDIKFADCVQFVSHIMDNVVNDENIIQPGTKWFIPGTTYISSHEDIKEICLEKNMAVLVVNGKGTVLTLPHTRKCIELEKGEDAFNTSIANIYRNYNLSKYPFVITGNICIGRGITITSEDFMIDYAILSHCVQKNEASQIAGRLKGNIKLFPNYKRPVVYTTTKFDEVATEWELRSRALAHIAWEKNMEFPTVVSKREFEERNISSSVSDVSEEDSVNSTETDKEEKKKRKELRNELLKHVYIAPIQSFVVSASVDANDVWAEAYRYYNEMMGSEIHGKSKPNRDTNRDETDPRFFKSSTTGKSKVFQSDALYTEISNMGYSNYQMKANCLKYARMYIGYKSLDDPTEYSIFVRTAEFEDTELVRNILSELGKPEKTEENKKPRKPRTKKTEP